MSEGFGPKPRYYFGRTPAIRVDMFAYPRTGSHYFRYCTQGLFDLVAIPGAAADDREAISRQSELDPHVLYALDLREDGVPFQPVWFHTTPNGQHGLPVKSEAPCVILTREPIATAYSYWRVSRDRDGFGSRVSGDAGAWIGSVLGGYHQFLTHAARVRREHPEGTLVIQYERLRESPEPLRSLVELLRVRPKLRPEFVHRLTRFDEIVRPGERTFYRAGDNDAWRRDGEFAGLLGSIAMPDFSAFDFVERSAR